MFDSIHQFIEFIEQKYADRIAFRWRDEETGMIVTRTYLEFTGDLRQYVGYLQAEIPETAHRHIGICAVNSYAYIVALFAVLLSDATVVLLNTRESAETLRDQIKFADVDRVLCDQTVSSELKNAVPAENMWMDIHAYQRFEGSSARCDEEDPDRLALLMFTSGTTSVSKCVMLSIESIFGSISGFMAYLMACFSENQAAVNVPAMRFLLMMPFYHVSGNASVITHLALGNELDINVDMKNIYRDLADFGSVTMFIVPMIYDLWKKDLLNGRRERLGCIKSAVVGGATVDVTDFLLFQQNGIQIMQAYGMSEMYGGGTTNDGSDIKRMGSVGKPAMGTEIRIVDGEVCFRGPNIMKGYYKNPEATADVIRDGWLYTGDLGYMDEKGYLYITGRKKNLIILASGENVSPEELEALLLKNADIKEALVKEKDGKICAEIFCDAEKQQEIRAFVSEINRGLPFYKRMTLVEFRSEAFEKTGSGKIKRNS